MKIKHTRPRKTKHLTNAFKNKGKRKTDLIPSIHYPQETIASILAAMKVARG